MIIFGIFRRSLLWFDTAGTFEPRPYFLIRSLKDQFRLQCLSCMLLWESDCIFIRLRPRSGAARRVVCVAAVD